MRKFEKQTKSGSHKANILSNQTIEALKQNVIFREN